MSNKERGNREELKIAKLLTKISGIQFHRVGVCSGARHTTQGINAVGFIGDVFTEHEEYSKLIIEVKATKHKIELTDIFNPKSLLSQYILQCERECNNQEWVLIVVVSGKTPFWLCIRFPEDVMADFNVAIKYNHIFRYGKMTTFDKYLIGELSDELRPKDDNDTNEEISSVTEEKS